MIPPVLVPISSKEIMVALKTIIAEDGNEALDFEQKISEYIGCKHSILTYSGRTALYVLLKAYGLDKGDEIIMPAYMCETVSQLLLDIGLKPNYVDIEPDTYNLSINDLNKKVNEKTKAIVAVHLFGIPCDMHSIRKIATKHNLIVIEDAAQAMGAEYYDKRVGTIGDAGFFSFGPGKPITTIGGGTIVTNDDTVAEKSRAIIREFKEQRMLEKSLTFLKLFGYTSIKNRMIYNLIHKRIRNEKSRINININDLQLKFTNIQASMGLIQLSKLDGFNKSRNENAEYLRENLNAIEGIDLPKIPEQTKPTYWRLPVKLSTEVERDELLYNLEKSGIESSVVFPITLPRLYSLKEDEFACAEEAVKKTVALPTHPLVRKQDLRKIVDVIRVMKEYIL